jgi:hypothetical protein
MVVSILSHVVQAFDFRDQEGQVGAIKADARCRDTVMLDVGRHVLMMWEAGGKTGIVRMLLRIIPTQ